MTLNAIPRKLKTVARLFGRWQHVLSGLQAMRNEQILSVREHLRLCSDWLLTAQRCSPDSGYSAFYSLVTGWAKGYIETTGYIIPTMLDLAHELGEDRCRRSALEAAEWLLTVQHSDGAFPDMHTGRPEVFDTGQVMIGTNRMFRETGDTRYLDASRRAADWLVSAQDPDGSWASMGYHRGHASTYHTRVAAALLECGQLTSTDRHCEAARRNLNWARSRQTANGFFQNAELSLGHDPVLHTMVYVLEGFLMAYRLTGEREWLETVENGANPLKTINLERDLVLGCQYRDDLSATNEERCVPGLAQWAGLCLDLHELTGDGGYLEPALLSLYYVKSKQLQCSGILRGAIPASVPLWGYYHPFCFVNWGVKFLADALLKYLPHERCVAEEQELWVRHCFKLGADGGGWAAASTGLDPFDREVIKCITHCVRDIADRELAVLDLGCGTGRFLRHLGVRYPHWRMVGVDPSASNGETGVRCGSAYSLPFPNASFDVVYTYIVLQHVSEMPQALAEIKRVLKPGATLIVGDRDLVSGRGLLKPYHEIRGLWMYPWDSPFRERWYTAGQWRRMLARSGFRVRNLYRLQSPGDRGLRRAVGMNRFLVIHATNEKLPRDSGRGTDNGRQ